LKTPQYGHVIAGNRVSCGGLVVLAGRWFRDAMCAWKSIEELRLHEPTRRLNGDVLEVLAEKYGSALENAPYAMSRSLLVKRDPYAERASYYAKLEWVRDRDLLDRIFKEDVLLTLPGVLDLGCGPAFVGEYLAAVSSLKYVGIDRSFNMMLEARERLGNSERATLLHEDFLNRTNDIGERFDGYLFLLKNVLHLIDDIYSLWGKVMDLWGKPSTIVIVETVSPTIHCRTWIDHIFKEMGVEYKKHFFTVGDLDETINGSLGTVDTVVVDQFIDVNSWVESFDLDRQKQSGVLESIVAAPSEIASLMQIHTADGKLKMLRRQKIIVAQP
jgi:SAM-dependent methyltransferase